MGFDGLLASRNQENCLRIICFYVRFTGFRPNKPMPESLTLVYLPRSSNDLAIDGSKIRPGSKALLGLYRVADVEKKEAGEFIFGSRERVQVSEGVRFEVYLSEERVLEGVFRRADDVEKWKLECGDDGVGVVEICVAVEGHVTLSERVVMSERKSKRGSGKLDVIPEGREVAEDEPGGGCCCDRDGRGMDGGEGEGGWRPDCEKVEMELEGVRWAIDVGVWVMCLGVGYMVARASAKSLRRSRFL
ncbi:hypothetical protein OIU76_003848 [Salix suchowensis]|uniref:Uncharacterized protein n=1 Tax=Salix suchowensis TaxID=1278906 RepID=A0ABQ9BPJ4_9ROSI|nr:hypothetical protein OIU78_013610 [Salix suchowensis]KAJ6347233.1 hypothetical protein OIU76_003848 [Salix suchowensis]KAJ6388446.1 hypothetical protein OIU77_026923 [Salix suchowensis]